jgi:hypothetical protein
MPMWTEGIIDINYIAANGSSIAIADRGWQLVQLGRFRTALVMQDHQTPAPNGVLLC